MKIRKLSIVFLALVPFIVRAESVVVARPGDRYDLQLSGVPDDEASSVNRSYTIDAEGMMNLPYIGMLKVSGLPLNKIQELIQNRYIEGKIFVHPMITLTPTGKNKFVNVMGEVKSPHRVICTADLTLMGAITECGGLYSDTTRVELVRDDKKTIYSLKEIERSKAEDPRVLPGDQIIVPRRSW